MLLHSSEALKEQALKVCDGVYLGGDMQFLQEAIATADGPTLRLCFGYTGWEPGQLEREFLSGNWFLAPATAQHVFETRPEKIWQTILREMGGILKQTEKLVFDCVGFAPDFSPIPRSVSMNTAARLIRKIGGTSLSNSKVLQFV